MPTASSTAPDPLRAPAWRRARARKAGAAGLALGALLAATPAAHADGGGVSVSASAEERAKSMIVRKISCIKGCSSIYSAVPGSTLRFQGPMLTRGKRVVYLGGAGTEDDVLAQLRVRKTKKGKLVTATLPKRARSGPVAIEITPGARSDASASKVVLPEPVKVLAPLPGNGPFFPIRGTSKLGTGSASFGGGRGHQGHDVFAKCGTPLVAAEGGTVLFKEFQSRAGNYVVIDVDGADRDEAYMHLRTPALVDKGDTVAAGQQIGEVGETGRASGCHLHFELWEGSWQGLGGKSGKPIDPLPTLKSWRAGVTAEPASR